MGGALASFKANVVRRHPHRARPIIDWDLILVMEPTTMLGAVAGSYLNAILPTWMTSAALAILLSFVAANVIIRTYKIYKQEKQGEAACIAGPVNDAASEAEALIDAEAATPISVLLPEFKREMQEACETERLVSVPISDYTGYDDKSQSSIVWRGLQHGHHYFDNVEGPVLSPILSTSAPLPSSLTSHLERHSAHIADHPASVHGPDRVSDLLQPAAYVDHSKIDLVEAADHEENGDLGLMEPLLGKGEGAVEPALSERNCVLEQREAQNAELEQILKAESKQVPFLKIDLMLLLSAWSVAADTLKGTVDCGSPAYWLSVTSTLPVVLLLVSGVRLYLLHVTAAKARVGLGPETGDVLWTRYTTIVYPVICTLAGVMAGTFGVGGGIIKGPLLLELGVPPEVAAATTASMILFTSGAATISYVHFGFVPLDYGILVGFLGFFSTWLGHVVVSRFRSSRRFTIVAGMAGLLTASCLIMYYQAATRVIEVIEDPDLLFRWGDICLA